MRKTRQRSPPFVVKVQLNSCYVCMEVDTGASASIVSEETFNSLCGKTRANTIE